MGKIEASSECERRSASGRVADLHHRLLSALSLLIGLAFGVVVAGWNLFSLDRRDTLGVRGIFLG